MCRSSDRQRLLNEEDEACYFWLLRSCECIKPKSSSGRSSIAGLGWLALLAQSFSRFFTRAPEHNDVERAALVFTERHRICSAVESV